MRGQGRSPWEGKYTVSGDAPGFRARLASPASAGIVFVFTLAAAAASLPLAALARQAAGNVLIFHAAVALLAVVLGGVGFVVARHQRRNPMGWLLLGSGLGFILGTDASFYATLAYRLHPGRLPLGWVAVLLNAGWALAFICLGAAVVLFPDGRLPSRHWRWPWRIYLALSAVWAGGGVVILLTAMAGRHVQIDSSGDPAAIDHPAGAAAPWGAVEQAWRLVLVACLVAAVIQQAAGYRRASGVRRQQLKWVASGAAFCVVCGVGGTVLNNAPEPWQVVADVLVAGIAALPVSMGVAILRYRLYDIDRIISRTLAYAIVSGLLVGVYAAVVLLATQVLRFHASVAVAVSTLTAAALFNPLRRRVQRAVDRRFNRARYDADQIVAAFAARLKDAVDLDSIRDDLTRVVNQSLEPAHISVCISNRD
jgi:MFS family permease